MFYAQSENCIPINFVNIYDNISLFAAELEEPKIGMWGKAIDEMDKLCKFHKNLTKNVRFIR